MSYAYVTEKFPFKLETSRPGNGSMSLSSYTYSRQIIYEHVSLSNLEGRKKSNYNQQI